MELISTVYFPNLARSNPSEKYSSLKEEKAVKKLPKISLSRSQSSVNA